MSDSKKVTAYDTNSTRCNTTCDTNSNQSILPSGRFMGKTYSWIASNNPDYCKWLADHCADKTIRHKAKNALMQHRFLLAQAISRKTNP